MVRVGRHGVDPPLKGFHCGRDDQPIVVEAKCDRFRAEKDAVIVGSDNVRDRPGECADLALKRSIDLALHLTRVSLFGRLPTRCSDACFRNESAPPTLLSPVPWSLWPYEKGDEVLTQG